MERKYLKNNDSGVIFPATPHLLENRHGLGMSFVEKEDYDRQEAGLAPVAVTEADVDPNKVTLIVDAITSLEAGNPKQWLKDGRPHAHALAAEIGAPVSSEERDQAWEEFQAQQGE